MITTRLATTDDLDWMLNELRAFDAFFASRVSLFPDDEHAVGVLVGLILEHVVFVAESDKVPVGFIAGVLAPHFFNPAIRHLSELFWWVVPSARGTSAGARLLARFESVGRARADWITMTLEADSPVNPSAMLKRGYRAKETNYLLEVA